MKRQLSICFLAVYWLTLTVNAAPCPADSPAVRPVSEIVGGRGAECTLTCPERLAYNLICYNDVGFVYDIYW